MTFQFHKDAFDPILWCRVTKKIPEDLFKNKLHSRVERATTPEIPESALDATQKRYLGKGAYGTVYECKYNNQLVAVKELMPTNGTEGIKNEIALACVCKHPNIVRFLGYTKGDAFWRLVMERAQLSLKNLLAKNAAKHISLPNWQVVKFSTDICLGMNFLHLHGLLHRDLNSGNYLIDTDWTVKITDFGTSHSTAASYGSRGCGASAYQPLDTWETKYYKSSDVWGFGIVFLEMSQGCLIPVNTEITFSELNLFGFNEEENDYVVQTKELRSAWMLMLPALWQRHQGLKDLSVYRPQFLDIAKKCFNILRDKRPTFGELVCDWVKLVESDCNLQKGDYPCWSIYNDDSSTL